MYVYNVYNICYMYIYVCICRRKLKFLIDFKNTKDYVRKYFFFRKNFYFIIVNEQFFLSLKYYNDENI